MTHSPTARWRECRTCPACGHQGWCRASDDGRIACRRLSAGAYKTITYKDGSLAYLHSSAGRPINFGSTTPRRPQPDAPRAADPELHKVYHMMLACAELRLQDHHRQQLRDRGLHDDAIRRAAYRTLPAECRAGIVRRLRDHVPDELLLAVPGIIRREPKHGSAYLTLAGRAGLLVPIRSGAGHTVALAVRPDNPADGGKYRWLSSAWHGGPSPGARVHVPAGVGSCQRAVIVEGALKSDVVHFVSGRPAIGLPGCHLTTEAVATLKALGVRQALLALDADTLTNPHVARAQEEGLRLLNEAGFDGGLVRWDKQCGKGLDDVLLNRRLRRAAR
jgi:hypothetical protein